jgi:hypothetical protein
MDVSTRTPLLAVEFVERGSSRRPLNLGMYFIWLKFCPLLKEELNPVFQDQVILKTTKVNKSRIFKLFELIFLSNAKHVA